MSIAMILFTLLTIQRGILLRLDKGTKVTIFTGIEQVVRAGTVLLLFNQVVGEAGF